jgi:nucleoside-diphosphate-sugar epimerase
MKIIELVIDEKDEMSGIDAVSVVHSPAIEENFIALGKETSVKELVETISELVGYKGNIVWDSTKPDGQPKRFYNMDKFKNSFGYVPDTKLKDGLTKTIEWYESNK